MICLKSAPLALLMFVLVVPARASWISPFISEIHYDNASIDAGEFVAVTAPVGLDLSDWQIILYNGVNGQPYGYVSLSGQVRGAGGDWAEAYWPIAGIQNGHDAVALLSAADELVDFIAYEAGVIATGGPVAGAAARLLPVAESANTAAGQSLQRVGGSADWDWVLAGATPGMLNPGLSGFDSAGVPAMGTGALWLSGIAAWLLSSVRGRPGLIVARSGMRHAVRRSWQRNRYTRSVPLWGGSCSDSAFMAGPRAWQMGRNGHDRRSPVFFDQTVCGGEIPKLRSRA